MTRRDRCLVPLSLAIAGMLTMACSLPRPSTVPVRMIEPQFTEIQSADGAAGAASLRLMETQTRGHIGRRLLHQLDGGELQEDAVWRWSSAPDRYLDSALRLAVAARPYVRVVESGNVPALGLTLISFYVDAASGSRLVAAVEIEVVGVDRVVHTAVIRGEEALSGEPPGNLAQASGRLLQRLAADALARALQRGGERTFR
jgi:hypothetical protein